MTARPVRRIVVVGNGVAAWTAALMLARSLDGRRYGVHVVTGGDDPHGLGPVGPALPIRPGAAQFLDRHGLDEDRLLAAAGGAFTLGSALTGWRGDGATVLLPFGAIGAPIGPVAFHQLAARARADGFAVRLADFALAGNAAQAERFVRPSSDPQSVLSSFEYGFSVDAAAFAGMFRDAALHAGARAEDGHAVGGEIGADGALAALRLADGGRIEGDLFVDASGGRALAIGALPGDAWEDWTRWLPCDRAIAASARDPHPPLPFTHAGAMDTGWRLSVPLDGGRGDVLCYASAHLDDAAAGRLLPGASAPMRCAAGRRTRMWNRNCVAIGAAATMIEPLVAGAFEGVVAAIDRLLALFPERVDEPLLAAEYDRQAGAAADRLRDWTILHYRLNGRVGQPMWDAARQVAPPNPLAWKIAQWESRGCVVLYDEDVFERDDWAALFDAMGLAQRRRDAQADAIPQPVLLDHFRRLRQVMSQAVAAMPSHADTLAQIKGDSQRKNR